MKCEGRPNGPCPDNKNDSTVHHTIGDLFLCNSCEEFRWPTETNLTDGASVLPASKTPTRKNIPGSDGRPRGSGSKDSAVNKKGDTRKQAAVSPTPTATAAATNPTTGKAGKVTRSTKVQKNTCHSDEADVGLQSQQSIKHPDDCTERPDESDSFCGHCLLPTSDASNKRCIKCDVCCVMYHQHCTNITVKVFDALIKIKRDVGWVCDDCREFVRTQSKTLQAAMSTLTVELATIRTELSEISQLVGMTNDADTVTPPSSNALLTDEVAAIRVELAEIKQQVMTVKSTTQEATYPSHSIPAENTTHFSSTNEQEEKQDDKMVSMVVYRTLNDAARRKRNVVIAGLPENPATDDREEFTYFCERYLTLKPFVVNCKRLGQIIEGKTRKLLVRLTSDAAAADLINAARQLHYSPEHEACRVYINADQSPAEAKLAFEARKQRRERKAQQQQQQQPRLETVAAECSRATAEQKSGVQSTQSIPDSNGNPVETINTGIATNGDGHINITDTEQDVSRDMCAARPLSFQSR